MTDDSRLDRIERSIQELLERIERLESSGVRHSGDDLASRPTHSTVPTVDPAADEATPTVPSAASVLEPAPPTAPPTALPTSPSTVTRIPHDTGGPPTRQATAGPDLERMVGTRLVAVAGGLLVALAAAFFAKLAYDRGWIGAIPPVLRAASLAFLGAGLLGLAEVLRRRLGKAAAIGCALAGLGTLYVDGWAIGSVLDLVSAEGSIVALALTTLVGLVVTARFGSLLLGGVSVVAGGIAPSVVGGEPSVLAPGLYFTALLAAALGAAIVRPHPFSRLRPWAAVILLAVAMPWWLGAVDAGETTILLLVSIAWWLVVHASSLVAALRGHDWRTGSGLNLGATAVIAIPVPIAVSALGGGPGLLAPEGWTVFGFAALSVAMAFQFGPGLGALSSPPPGLQRRDRCRHRIAETAWLEAAVLLMLAAALLLRGAALPIAWVGVALGVAVFAARRGSRRAAVFAGVAAVLAQGAASFTVMQILGPLTSTWLDGTPFRVSAVPQVWIVLAAGAATVATAIWWPAAPSGRRGPWGPASVMACGVLPWLVPAAMLGGPGWWMLFVIAPAVAAVLVTRRRPDHAAWRFGISWATIALVPMTAALAIPILGTLDGSRAISDWAADARVVMRDWGGPTITMLGVAATVVGLLAAIAGIGRTARIGPDQIDARARASMRLLPVAATPFGAALLMVAVPATRVGWSSWIGPPMVGATGVVMILTLLVVLRWSGSLLASTRFSAVLGIVASAVWMLAAIVSAVVSDVAPADPPPIVNVRGFTGIGLVVMLALMTWAVRILDPRVTRVVGGVTLAAGLVLGSVLVQDLAGRGTLAADSGISIWWAVYAIGLIIAGFRFDLGVLRKVGLGLLGVTAVKFLVIDLRNAETIHRIVSALGVGLLMVLTSVIYVRAGGGENTENGE